jgi:hypothetical protein
VPKRPRGSKKLFATGGLWQYPDLTGDFPKNDQDISKKHHFQAAGLVTSAGKIKGLDFTGRNASV